MASNNSGNTCQVVIKLWLIKRGILFHISGVAVIESRVTPNTNNTVSIWGLSLYNVYCCGLPDDF